MILIKNELKQVEELENVDLPDDLLEMINAATNGDMERVNAIRQFLDLEDEPASFFQKANLSVRNKNFNFPKLFSGSAGDVPEMRLGP